MKNNSTGGQCFPWMEATMTKPNVTLDEINQQHIRRFLGGIWLLSFVLLIGLLGNSHVLYIYFRKFKTSNYRVFVIWLGSLDMINCCFIAPLMIFYLHHPLNYPSMEFCKVTRFSLYLFAIASTSSLVVIAIERYRKIMTPYATQISLKQAKLMCFVSVLTAMLLSWPAPVLYGLSHVPTGVQGVKGHRCITENKYERTNYMAILHISHLVFFIIVSTSLISVYACISKRVLRSRKYKERLSITRSIESETSNDQCVGKNVRKTFTFLTVTFAYILCALPHHSLALLYFLSNDLDCKMSLLQSQFYYAFVWSYFVNSAINPCIYAYRDKKFREEVRHFYGSLFNSMRRI